MGPLSADASSRALCSAIASHPLGTAPSLSPSEFQVLCRAMAGAFPDLVRRGFKGIIRSDEPAPPYNRAKFDLGAPEPNPVDFDWRFDEPTANYLAETLMSVESSDPLCIGTPTVYEALNNRGRRPFLIDRNPLLSRTLTAGTFLINDLSTEDDLQKVIARQFDTAILDPPWYTEAYHLWLARTLPLMRPGGKVFIVLFRSFTRPNAQSERNSLLQRFRSIGQVTFLNEVVYSTPPFEAEVLSRLALPVMPSWRAADLLSIELNPNPDTKVFTSTDWPLSEWERFALEEQVVAIRRIPTDEGSISFADATSYELQSVSHRDKERTDYTVWTSRNKAAAVAGTRRLAAIFNGGAEEAVDPSDLVAAARLSQRLGFKIRGLQ